MVGSQQLGWNQTVAVRLLSGHHLLRRRVRMTSLATFRTLELVLIASFNRLKSKQKSKDILVVSLIIIV